MLKRTIHVNEHSDPDQTLSEFRDLCRASGIAKSDELIEKVESAVAEFSQRGSELASVGSSFNISREITGDDHAVIVEASFGEKPSLVNKIGRLFGR
jgi:hypothetical protein